MKGGHRHRAFLFAVAIVLLATPLASAQSPFDGTWRTNPDEAPPSGTPVRYLLQDGVYLCKACNAEGQVKADGKDYPILPTPAYDTINITEAGPSSVEIRDKKDGQTKVDSVMAVSADGKTMTEKVVNYFLSSQPLITETTFTRLAEGPAGANLISGSWRTVKTQPDEKTLITTFKSNGDGLDMSTPLGNSYSAKFDGKSYPVVAALANVENTVSLKLINDHTFEETRKVGDTLTIVRTFTVSEDGKKMTIVTKNLRTGAGGTSVAYKQ